MTEILFTPSLGRRRLPLANTLQISKIPRHRLAAKMHLYRAIDDGLCGDLSICQITHSAHCPFAIPRPGGWDNENAGQNIEPGILTGIRLLWKLERQDFAAD